MIYGDMIMLLSNQTRPYEIEAGKTDQLVGLWAVSYTHLDVYKRQILQRFYKNLLSGEGYLMHTLPVRPWQHIASKLIAAVVWTVLSFFVVCVSCLLYTSRCV